MRGPSTSTTNRARSLRKLQNEAEAALWSELRSRRLNGHKFVRQHPIGPYFADFVCRARRLVVEVDGSQHVGSKTDETRDRYMNEAGWSVLRVWSNEVLSQRQAVLETIAAALEGRLGGLVDARDVKYRPAQRAGYSVSHFDGNIRWTARGPLPRPSTGSG